MDASNNIFTPYSAMEEAAEPMVSTYSTTHLIRRNPNISQLPLYTSGTPPPYTPPSHPATTPNTDLKHTTTTTAIHPVPSTHWSNNTKKPFLFIAIAALFFVVVPLVMLATSGCAAVHKQRMSSHAVLKPTYANTGSDGGLSGTIASGLARRSIEGFGKMG